MRSAENPARRKRAEEKLKYLSDYQVERLFAVVKSLRDRAMLRIALHRGLRASELGLIDFAHWDNREGVLYVTRLKGSRSGPYRLLPVEAAALRAWIRERGTAAGAMFPSRNHRPISRFRLDKLFKFYCTSAGIPRDLAHMHALKHTCGTHTLRVLRDITAVQDWLGHRQLQNTLIYAQVANETREESTAKLRDWGRKSAA